MQSTANCTHKWAHTNDELLDIIKKWHENADAPTDNFYKSKYALHYFITDVCKECGEFRLYSAVFDRDDVGKQISEEEFLWLTLFITQLNEESGYVEKKIELINDALDQMPWAYFPYVNMHSPKDNYFSISYKDDRYLRYNWDFEDALKMFREMNSSALTYMQPDLSMELNAKLRRLDDLKKKYQKLMEISSQAGTDSELQSEINTLYNDFKKLSEEINRLV